MKKYIVISSLVALASLMVMCRKAQPIAEDTYDERLSGGAATVFDETSNALSHALPGLNERDSRMHGLGDAGFGQTFVTDPAPNFGGIGPIFNNVSCISCHHNDGKGTPTAGTITSSLLIRIGSGVANEHGGPTGMPGYGNQVQDMSVQGIVPEAKVSITYTDKVIVYPDGSKVALRAPAYALLNAYISLGACQLSPRLAPPVFGLGLIENIPEATIAGFAQANKSNTNGIGGHPNYVYNPATKRTEIGRFGLKANTSSLYVQVASAFQQDMGITNTLFPEESCYGQSQASAIYQPGKINLPDSALNEVTFYVRSLAVPARRNVSNPVVRSGEAIFRQINCSGCHIPTMHTGVDLAFAQLSNQRIHPYTDLLLHDMGPDLADGYTDYLATGNEWKTPALWGIGLFEKTNGTPYYLHDGRARTLEEAILWHGGEAQNAKAAFMQLGVSERNALIAFLKSL
ncbi:MAG TPA: di-heme oxidoredictase family protein [Chitinophagaceae bacterium]|nr:di-heme oxidoredictase family protein [Chitinophagaceae bacterium]